MALVNLDPNNAFAFLAKKAYVRNNTAADTAYGFSSLQGDALKIPYKKGVYLGTLKDFVNVGGRVWAKIKLQYIVEAQKTTKSSWSKSRAVVKYGELWFAAEYVAADDMLLPNVVQNGSVVSSDIWANGKNINLRATANATSKILNVFQTGDYLGKSDAVKIKGGIYAGGSTWYKITLPDARIGYIATPYGLFRKPVTGRPSSGTPAALPTKQLSETEIEPVLGIHLVISILKNVAIGLGVGLGVLLLIEAFKKNKQ